ncbi:response regulator transcription factor [Rhodococcus sp. IEGM 1408]|uniref:helix-turn-helix transcriptional regulator n=1 Tax=Rhodococcus sp. IEGM 1408 TaxID=3082220 RepID=UPI0029551A39|nr:response regulator transcription factor [Rhodococcus sp. IEGM 1408]MDV8002361.1 response regulator transcription factor [Rhodococcus sp. IEGM 1408]
MLVRVSVVNDYSVVIAGVRALLSPYSDRVEVTVEESVSSYSSAVDVVLFDTFASPNDWQARCAAMALDPRIGFVAAYSFITTPRAVEDAFAAGATGYLGKSLAAEALVEGIERVAAGESVTVLGDVDETGSNSRWPGDHAGLTPRESEVLALIVQGRSNDQIAATCYLSINTVKSYIRDAYRKIGVTTRAQAVAWGMRHGLHPSP